MMGLREEFHNIVDSAMADELFNEYFEPAEEKQ